jgi:hypothetical protein
MQLHSLHDQYATLRTTGDCRFVSDATRAHRRRKAAGNGLGNTGRCKHVIGSANHYLRMLSSIHSLIPFSLLSFLLSFFLSFFFFSFLPYQTVEFNKLLSNALTQLANITLSVCAVGSECSCDVLLSCS